MVICGYFTSGGFVVGASLGADVCLQQWSLGVVLLVAVWRLRHLSAYFGSVGLVIGDSNSTDLPGLLFVVYLYLYRW